MKMKVASWNCCHEIISLIIIVSLIYGLTNASESEYYSSIAGLETLLKTEHNLLKDLKAYVETTKNNIESLENVISLIEIEHKIANIDAENYLANPVNVYKLIKRLFTDWKIYREHIAAGSNYIQLLDQQLNHINHPDHDDLEESALALVRLQTTYNLEVAQVASGILNGVKYGNEMSWSDCLMVGQQLLNAGAYNQTKLWIRESARRYTFSAPMANEIFLDFMEQLGESLMRIGDNKMALQVFQTVLRRNPQRLDVLSHMFENTPTLPEDCEKAGGYHASNEFKLYEKVCREEITRSPAEERNLKCRYQAFGHCDFCRLAPFKVEDISLDPLIVIYHDMIGNEAIERLKNLSLPIMGRSMVRGMNEGISSKTNYRISKNAWLTYESHPYAMKILRDLHDATGLDMSHSEQLQVANYGLGGHYEPHVDFILNVPVGEQSNRISTSIIYLSNVEQGGATAFPFLRIAIKPNKGNVLFWYNLHRSLDGDYRTKHAGCPVLKGSKWIANVWTHDIRQDAHRPCALYRDHETSQQYEYVN